MGTPHDLRHFDANDYEDSFRLIAPGHALAALVALVLLAAVLEPVLR